jgi:hypothetical protein
VTDSAQRFTFSQRVTLAIVPRLVALLLRALHRTLRYEVVVEPGVEPATPPALLAPLPHSMRLLLSRSI